MKKLDLLLTAAISSLLSLSVSALPDRIGDFGLIDSDGEPLPKYGSFSFNVIRCQLCVS